MLISHVSGCRGRLRRSILVYPLRILTTTTRLLFTHISEIVAVNGVQCCDSANVVMIAFLFVLASVSALDPRAAPDELTDVSSSPFLDPHAEADTAPSTTAAECDNSSVGCSAVAAPEPELVPGTLPDVGVALEAYPALRPFNESVEVRTSVCVYDAALLRSIRPMLAVRVSNQLRVDLDNSSGAPRLDQDGELVRDGGSVGHLAIGELLFTTATATILSVRDDPSRVVKYSHNCADSEELHLLVRDYIVLKYLEGLKVAPRAMYLSPPVQFPPWKSSKTSFRIDADTRAYCAANPDVQVRFMVMERVQTTLDLLMMDLGRAGRRLPLVQCIHIMLLLLDAIERIHNQGLIHGDVHWGNVALVNDADGQGIQLIDFGKAMFADEMRSLPDMARAPRSYNHCFFSHWNIDGYRFSYRDDVYKALLVGAFLINGRAFSDLCVGLEKDVNAMISFKRDEFIFVPTLPGGDHIGSLALDDGVKRTLRRRLSNALQSARSVVNLDDRPNYACITAELTSAFRVLNAVQAPKTTLV